MLNQRLLAALCFILLLCSCSGPQMVEPEDNPKDSQGSSRLEIVWQTKMHNEKAAKRHLAPLICGDLVISSMNKRLSDEIEIILAYNKNTGEKIWEWKDYDFSEFGERNPEGVASIVDEKFLFWPTQEGLYVIDVANGQTVWKKPGRDESIPYYSDLNYSVHGEYIHQPYQYGNIPYTDSVSIKRINIYDGEEHEYLMTHKTDRLWPNLFHPSVWVDTNGDTMVCTYTVSWASSPLEHNVDVIQYNLSNDEIIWRKENLDPFGASSLGPTIDENRIYIMGNKTVFCLDITSGDIIWQDYYPEGGGLQFANPVFDQNHLYFKSNSGDVLCLNKYSGERIWNNNTQDVGGVSFSGVTYFDNRLYFSDGSIYIVDCDNGEVLLNEISPNHSIDHPSTYFSSITIDEKERLIYLADGYYILCIKIPE